MTEEPTGKSGGLAQWIERGAVFSAECPSRGVLRHVTSRWGVLVLVALLSGTWRFSELRRKIGGVSEKMLAETLQVLEADGFVHRKSYPVVPPHVEYSLTPLGTEIAARIEDITDWIELNIGRILKEKGNSAPDEARAAKLKTAVPAMPPIMGAVSHKKPQPEDWHRTSPHPPRLREVPSPRGGGK